MCFEGVWKVSEKRLEGILKVSEYCLEDVWKVFLKCLGGVWKASSWDRSRQSRFSQGRSSWHRVSCDRTS